MKRFDYIVDYGTEGSELQRKLNEWTALGYRLHTVSADHTAWMIVMEMERSV